jgi:hypothetical protein
MALHQHRGTIMGTFPSLKKPAQTVNYASSLERDLLYFFEWDTDILDYHAKPFTITVTDQQGIEQSYTPTFQVSHTTGKKLIECRSSFTAATDIVQLPLAMGKAWADENDHEFVVVTSDDLRSGHRLANLKLLWRYSRLSISYEHITQCQQLLQNHSDGLSFSVIAGHLAKVEDSLIHAPTLYALLFRHILRTDLDQPLTRISRLYYGPQPS